MNIAFVLSTLRALDRVENQKFIKHGVAFVNRFFFKSQTMVLVNDDENISHHNILQFQNILGFFSNCMCVSYHISKCACTLKITFAFYSLKLTL